MPEQTLAAWFKEQLQDNDLTKRDKSRLVRIVDECIERYSKVRDIQKGSSPSKFWVAATRALQASLQKLSPYVEIPCEFQAVIKNGPKETLEFYESEMMEALLRRFGACPVPQDAFVEVAKVGLLFLSELRGVLQETKPKGNPGRDQVYVKSVAMALEMLQRSGSNRITKEICNKCKSEYPGEFQGVKTDEKFRAFKRAVREAQLKLGRKD